MQLVGAAIAAVLTDPIVDDDALRRIREGLALAPAPLLGGAGLVVHQHGNAGKFAQLALDRVQLASLPDRHAARDAGVGRVLLGSSATTTIRSTSAATCRTICGTVSVPSTGCPPVIATAC